MRKFCASARKYIERWTRDMRMCGEFIEAQKHDPSFAEHLERGVKEKLGTISPAMREFLDQLKDAGQR